MRVECRLSLVALPGIGQQRSPRCMRRELRDIAALVCNLRSGGEVKCGFQWHAHLSNALAVMSEFSDVPSLVSTSVWSSRVQIKGSSRLSDAVAVMSEFRDVPSLVYS